MRIYNVKEFPLLKSPTTLQIKIEKLGFPVIPLKRPIMEDLIEEKHPVNSTRTYRVNL